MESGTVTRCSKSYQNIDSTLSPTMEAYCVHLTLDGSQDVQKDELEVLGQFTASREHRERYVKKKKEMVPKFFSSS